MSNAQPTSALPFYDCHKRVQAGKIAQIAPHSDDSGADILFAVAGDVEVPTAIVSVDGEFMARHKPEVGGYYVLYQDGYASFSPAEAFEGGYTAVGQVDEATATLNGALDTIATRDLRIAELEARDAEQAHKIADLQMALEDKTPAGAVVPAGTFIRINAFPFHLVADAVVEASQQHVDEQIREQARVEALPPTGTDEAGELAARPGIPGLGGMAASAPAGGQQLEKFLRKIAGTPKPSLTIHPEADGVVVAMADLHQTTGLAGIVRGNRFEPR